MMNKDVKLEVGNFRCLRFQEQTPRRRWLSCSAQKLYGGQQSSRTSSVASMDFNASPSDAFTCVLRPQISRSTPPPVNAIQEFI